MSRCAIALALLLAGLLWSLPAAAAAAAAAAAVAPAVAGEEIAAGDTAVAEAPPAAVAEPAGDLTLRPAAIGIGLGYHGARLRVEAPVAEDREVVFILAGPVEPVRLKVKSRVGGVLWASVGEVGFQEAPTLLLAHAWPRPASPAVLREAGLSDAAILARSLPPDASAADSAAFGEMLKLLRKQGRLGVETAGERVGGRVATEFALPPAAPVGDYQVSAVLFRDGVEVGRLEAPLAVRKVGLVAWLSRLARHEGFWYGLAAVAVAVLAGLLTGYIFGRGGSGAH